MVITTLSLLTTCLSILFDTKSDGVPVPHWARVFFFKYLARLFCLRQSVTAVLGEEFGGDPKVQPIPKGCNMASDDVMFIESLDETKSVKKSPRRQGNAVEELLLKELRTITGYLAEKGEAERRSDEWRLLAKVIDRLLFWVCLVVTTAYMVNIAVVIQNQ